MTNTFKKILVVGAGTMGHGIAQVFALNGYRVSLVDLSQQSLNRAKVLIESSLDTMAEAGLMNKNQINPIMRRILSTTILEESASDADLVIECIDENAEAKRDLFKKLDALCPPHTLLCSNSTFLNIFDIVEISRPDKLLMTHWYAPPQIIPLVDVVKGPATDETHVRTVIDLLKKMGKKPVVFQKPCAGYIVSRLQVAFQREVYWLLDNCGLSPHDLDEAAVWGLAMRMLVLGICQRIDFGGLDISASTLLQAPAQCTPLDYQPRKLTDLVEQGALGIKTGRGFYDYSGETEADICRKRDIRLLKLLKFLQDNNLAGPII